MPSVSNHRSFPYLFHKAPKDLPSGAHPTLSPVTLYAWNPLLCASFSTQVLVDLQSRIFWNILPAQLLYNANLETILTGLSLTNL